MIPYTAQASVPDPERRSADRPWLAAYTRPKCEGKVRSYCDARGITTFLPSHLSWRRWTDRKKLLQMPLFPSYLFLRADALERRSAAQAPGFLRFVSNRAGPVPVDEEELETVRRLLHSGLAYDPLPTAQAGEEVEIVTGALRGCRGRLVRKDGSAVVLLVSAIQAAVRVSLPDPTWVRALPPGCAPPRR
jgi:transcription antitermination factor NusG